MDREFTKEYELASAAGKALVDSPFAVVKALPLESQLVLELRNGTKVMIPWGLVPEVAGATVEQLRDVIVSPLKDGLYWEALDVSINTAGLLADSVGAIDARITGKRGGSQTSARKTQAVRANGKKGGRPKKVAGG